LFFASFLSWMVVQLHAKDWTKLTNEDDFLQAAQNLNLQPGNYTFPGFESAADMKTDEYKQKFETGPNGIMTIFPHINMGRNLGLTFVYFLVVSFCLGYPATLALEPAAPFMTVFRFVSTAALLAYLPAIVQHSIWFHCRITGHVIESIAYAAITATIFAAMWPAA
jgi:hypothetical protein